MSQMKPNVVVCAECDPPKYPVLPGYETGVSCLRCKRPLQITKYGARILRMGEVWPMCHGCAAELMKWRASDGKPTEINVRPGLLEEVAQRERDAQRKN